MTKQESQETVRLAIENLNSTALAFFRETVKSRTDLSEDWREAILQDTASGIPTELKQAAQIGRAERTRAKG